MPQTYHRKLSLCDPKIWPHHRSGWTFVTSLIQEHFGTSSGILFIGSVEDQLADNIPLQEPWVGFVHQVPDSGLEWFPDLRRLLRHPIWIASKPHCLGLFTLSSGLESFLLAHDIGVPVATIPYPFAPTKDSFNLENYISKARPELLFIGEYLRNFEDFYRLRAPQHRKLLLAPEGSKLGSRDDVTVIKRVENGAYDELLRSSLVFLSLFDAPANTTIVECIARATPILVNRLPGVIEYLGEDYPLLYNDLSQAEAMLRNPGLIRDAHAYLKTFPGHARITPRAFLDAMANSAIYRGLPLAMGDPQHIKSFDVSLVICSYKRVYNMRSLLEAFANQDYTGTFEILLWNNNSETQAELYRIYEEFRERLEIKLIQSTENYYCIVRLAAGSLIRSDVLLVCDDDVRPARGYIRRFMEKHEEYGDEAALCCRGHVFDPHALDEQAPHLFWENYDHLTFYNESIADRQVHFLHADNCLLPKSLLRDVLQYELPRYEFSLVDDYWMSFVISHHLKRPIWKIRADDILQMTPCSDDPKIALFHNPRVAEQRIAFYVYHMRRGWPFKQKASRPSETDIEPGKRAAIAGTMRHADPNATWNAGFRGVNMSADATAGDFVAAAQAGITVVRLGACGGGRDFRYLLDAAGNKALLLDGNAARLRATIRKATDCGLQVIIALNNLPGRLFSDETEAPDLRIWHNAEILDEAARLWGWLAHVLQDEPGIVGFDLMNEPFTPSDIDGSFFDETPAGGLDRLHRLYALFVEAIRAHDRKTPLIVSSTYWSSPLALTAGAPFQGDANLIHSFHFYAPAVYTDRARNAGRLCYPGLVPEDSIRRWNECRFWDRQALSKILTYVSDWQYDYAIPSSRLYVGEFGVAREALGAGNYLHDLATLFDERGWPWSVYAFRERNWDAMDYELGPQIDNMLTRATNPLYARLRDRFK